MYITKIAHNDNKCAKLIQVKKNSKSTKKRYNYFASTKKRYNFALANKLEQHTNSVCIVP